MKKIDDTPVDKDESESNLQDAERRIAVHSAYVLGQLDEIKERMDQLLIRIANLETQRTPQDENDDPEWFS